MPATPQRPLQLVLGHARRLLDDRERRALPVAKGAGAQPGLIGDNLTAGSSTAAVHARVSDYSDVTGVAGDAGAPTRIYQPRENATDGILAQRID